MLPCAGLKVLRIQDLGLDIRSVMTRKEIFVA